MNHDRSQTTDEGFVSLFDGRTLAGWRSTPRIYGTGWPGGPDAHPAMHPEGIPEHASLFPAEWEVVDGSIVGRQNTQREGFGGYLLTERQFGDFELAFDVDPDWPADTGVMLRRKPDSWHGYQLLVDHREEGSIGGFYGNGLASFHAIPFALGVDRDGQNRPIGLRDFGPAQTAMLQGASAEKRSLLDYAATAEEFLDAWRWGEWNEVRVLCEGQLPRLTSWVNGVKIAELDTAALVWPHFDAESVAAFIGRRGHIALEVHDRIPGTDDAFWGRGTVCRWRNIRIRELN